MRRIVSSRGFTLAELAIVLVIVGLLLGGLMVPLSAQTDNKARHDNDKAMADIHDALVGFAIANGRLPCPALATTPDTNVGAGLESTNGQPGAALACTNAAGVLPWATLGVSETDAWGNRFTYRVTPDFSRGATGQTTYTSGTCTPAATPPVPSSPPQFSAFALCSQGDMTILSTLAGGTNVSINIPAVVVSHGKNGMGAFTSGGTQLPASTDADEQSNQLNAAGTATSTTFVNKTPTPTSDDSVIWVSSNVLFNRMIAAGKLP